MARLLGADCWLATLADTRTRLLASLNVPAEPCLLGLPGAACSGMLARLSADRLETPQPSPRGPRAKPLGTKPLEIKLQKRAACRLPPLS